MFQTIYDDQDPNVHSLFTYGPRRFPVDGTLRKASIMIVEGIDDSFSPNNATRSEAFSTGPIPQLPPIAEPAAVGPADRRCQALRLPSKQDNRPDLGKPTEISHLAPAAQRRALHV